jgi:cobalt-zinc-cadmium efflux system outer membrane protein
MVWKTSVLALASVLCARTATVDDLIRIAIERNRELAAARARVAETRGLLRQAGVRPAPALEVDGSTGRALGSPGKEEFSAAYSHPLETGGKRDKRVRVAEKGVALAEAELAERTLRLASQVKLRAIDALTEEQRLASFDSLIGALQESLKLTEARVEQGDAAPLESRLLLVELNRTQAQRRTAEGARQVALTDLRRLCGLAPAEPLALTRAALRDSHSVGDIAQLRQRALAHRPDLDAARLVEEQGAAEVALNAAQARPDLTLSARYSHRTERFGDLYGYTASGRPALLRDRDNILAAGISIPLLTRRRNLGNLEAAAARATGARSLRQHLEAAIPLEVEAAWRRWEAAIESLKILNAGVVRQSEENLEIVRQAYALGQLRLLDVLNEQRRLTDTRMSHIEAEAGVRRGLAELEQAVGGELR